MGKVKGSESEGAMKDSTEHFTIRSVGNNRREIVMELGRVRLHADLTVPVTVKGLVLFAHGYGSNRASPRNRYVAEALNRSGFATCLPDFLTAEEAAESTNRSFRLEIGLLAGRLVFMTDWVAQLLEQAEPGLSKQLGMAYFGASTGAAVALMAAADRPDVIQAVVSRGGRVDLAEEVLGRVQAPTLLLVGENDEPVLQINAEAYRRLPDGQKKLTIIPGASHLFEEPGKLDEVACHTAQWLEQYLPVK